MARPSSIFSFDTLSALPRPIVAALLSVAVCVIVRCALSLRPDAFQAVPESELQQLYTFNELRYRTGEQPHPKVLVMGTSRLGILPAGRIAAAAGCDEHDVANYSLAGNTFWRTVVFFRRNPVILRDARVVIFDLLPFQLFEGSLNTGDDEVLLRLGSLQDRLEVPGWGRKALGIADLAFPAWSARHTVAGWQMGLRMAMLEPKDRAAAFTQAASAAQRYQATLAKGQAHNEGAQALRQYVPSPRISPLEENALRELKAMIPQDCTLYLAWLPVRSDFSRAVHDDPAAKASYDTFQGVMRSNAGLGAVVVWADNAQARFDEGDFTDLVHYSQSGIEKVCDELETALRADRVTR